MMTTRRAKPKTRKRKPLLGIVRVRMPRCLKCEGTEFSKAVGTRWRTHPETGEFGKKTYATCLDCGLRQIIFWT
jgi:hypothetical protein